jgi:hypothetical protein
MYIYIIDKLYEITTLSYFHSYSIFFLFSFSLKKKVKWSFQTNCQIINKKTMRELKITLFC